MSDLFLISGELKKQSEMLRLHRGILYQDTVRILSFLQDVLPEAVRNQCDLQITRITVIGYVRGRSLPNKDI